MSHAAKGSASTTIDNQISKPLSLMVVTKEKLCIALLAVRYQLVFVFVVLICGAPIVHVELRATIGRWNAVAPACH